jgi:hypothetical protein
MDEALRQRSDGNALPIVGEVCPDVLVGEVGEGPMRGVLNSATWLTARPNTFTPNM